jgi:mRNA-degrading endonuclease RelE of RelBE toxin-antitoxin system
MVYQLEVKEEADKIFKKLKNKNLLDILSKKINEIINNPYHGYKYLKYPLNNFNRVHINSHFVLIFKINHITKTIIIYYFAHHDIVYKWNPKK